KINRRLRYDKAAPIREILFRNALLTFCPNLPESSMMHKPGCLRIGTDAPGLTFGKKRSGNPGAQQNLFFAVRAGVCNARET
ncbi:MAG: hypothetical protein ACI4PD_06285, partial [Butyricicoccus sp.]